jgi:hypothetical protein
VRGRDLEAKFLGISVPLHVSDVVLVAAGECRKRVRLPNAILLRLAGLDLGLSPGFVLMTP